MLVERVASTLGAAGFKVATEVREGDSREMIIDSAKQWRADPGEYRILVGRSSQDIQLRSGLTLSADVAASANNK